MNAVLSTPVRLSLPAHADYVAIARGVLLIAAGRAGITLDAAEDLVLAVDEMCAALLGAGARQHLDVLVGSDGGVLRVEVAAPLEAEWPPAGWEDSTPALILEALVEDVVFRRDGDVASIVVAKQADAHAG